MTVNVNYTSLPTTDDPSSALAWISQNNDFFMPFILLQLFLTFTLGNFSYKERRNGKGNFAESAAFGSVITMVSAIVLNLIPNMFNAITLASTFIITCLLVLWYLITGGED
jgi:heme/copper-type cytochrome/quinol oxidase subunit 2